MPSSSSYIPSIRRATLAGGAFAALLAFTVILTAGTQASRGAASVVSPTMQANVLDDGNVHLLFADGTEVGSPTPPGPTIPAGSYTIQVNDDSEIDDIHITGPGVDMASGVVANLQTSWTITLQPGSSYRYTSDAHGNLGGYFQTSGSSTGPSTGPSTTGTTGGASSSTPSSNATSSSAASSSSSSTKSSTAAGSQLVGTLAGTVSPSGRLELELDGKRVTKLKAGRYKITVTDKASAHGFVVREKGHSAITLTGSSFVGTHSVTLSLTAGAWTFASATATNPAGSFTVAH